MTVWVPRFPLKLCLAVILLLVLTPTLGVIAVALYRSGDSYRQASTQRLLETVQVVARSVDGETDATARLVRGYAQVRQGEHGGRAVDELVMAHLGGSLSTYKVIDSLIIDTHGIIPEIESLVVAAATSGSVEISNLFTARTTSGDALRLALAVPIAREHQTVEVAVLQAPPSSLVRTLTRWTDASLSGILAITDGTGRIIARSVDGEQFVGRPVPDWATLTALGTQKGSFRAATIEGRQIVFGFQKIPGTPGWAAVVGEAATKFDARWKDPILTLLAAGAGTLLLALGFASLLTRQVLRPISLLADRARAIANSKSGDVGAITIDVPSSFVSEFETLRVSLDRADDALRQTLVESQKSEQNALQNARALQEAERIARIGSWSLDLATNEFSTSDMLYELNGADPQGPPITAESLQYLLTKESYQRVAEAIGRCISTGEPYGLEVDHLHVQRGTFQAYVQGKAIRDETGRIVKLAGTVQDISERKEERDRLAALANNLPSGVIFRLERAADGKFRVAYISAGIEQLIGWSAADIVARSSLLFEAIDRADRENLFEVLEQSSLQADTFDQEFRVTRSDGAQIWMHAGAALRTQPNGNLVWDGIARDITMERRAADALRAAKEAAERAERAKSDFLATMSHEIRTPMNTVIGMTRLALRTDLDSRQRNYLDKINTSAVVLLGIINDILDFSKIEAGGLQLENAEFTLESVLESVSAVTALKAEEKGLEIAYAIDPRAPARIEGDALRLGQVLTNLVGNAVKFTESGDVFISIRALDAAHGRSNLEFSVSDTGVGLTADQIAGLFRPFAQAGSDTSRKYGGTGLGLAICKRLVELMGGEIRVESTPGKGSTFIFTAQFANAASTAETSIASQASAALQGRRVLIVDDNDNARMALEEMTTAFGMSTQSCATGPAALQLLRCNAEAATPFDIVLLDWRMPEMDGLETARHIKADEALIDMPAVLMVTAYGHEIVLQALDEIDLQGILLKPVTLSVMFNTILGALTKSNRFTDCSSTNTPTIERTHAAFKALAGRHVLVVDDNALNREVATDFLHLVGITVDTAVNGLDAIRKMEETDFDVVLMDMHMPEMGGLEAVQEIRSRAEWTTLPVVALTAQARTEDQHASLEAGMTAHLTKPIDEVALYETLMQVLEPASDERTKVYQPSEREAASSGFSLDVDLLARRFGNNMRRVEGFLAAFMHDFGDMPREIDDLLRTGDCTRIADLAHQIKGTAGYIGATSLCGIADKLERAARNNDGEAVLGHGPAYRKALVACLNQVSEALAGLQAHAKAPAARPMSPREIIGLLDRVTPLVERGDFAAKDLLEQVGAAIVNSGHEALLRRAQDQYDDLELQSAVKSLRELKDNLQHMAMSGE